MEKLAREDISAYLFLECKDFRIIKLGVHTTVPPPTCRSIYAALSFYCFEDDTSSHSFAFYNRELEDIGADIGLRPNLAAEYSRILRGRENSYRFSDVNKSFAACPSYPELLVFPASVTDEMALNSAKFRSSGRLPVLSWISKKTQASLARSAQPMVGLKGHRNSVDEQVVRSFGVRNGGDNGSTAALKNEGGGGGNLNLRLASLSSTPLVIVDARPQKNAVGNMAKGMGFENADNYGVPLEFLGIENIHTMRKSWEKLLELVADSAVLERAGPNKDRGRWHHKLDDCGWLYHIACILKGALRVMQLMLGGVSVLVHCSDGWDRTAQLTSLSMLCMDPFYRTIDGFCTLVYKEWCAFGHPFGLRSATIKPQDPKLKEKYSPVFLQFLECVYHISCQHPTAFEFSSNLLIEMADAAYSCRFGDFLFCCERERVSNKTDEKCASFWDYAKVHASMFENALYIRSREVLYPKAAVRLLTFWSGYYFRWDYSAPMHTALEREIIKLKAEIRAMRTGAASAAVSDAENENENDLGAKGDEVDEQPRSRSTVDEFMPTSLENENLFSAEVEVDDSVSLQAFLSANRSQDDKLSDDDDE